MAKKDTGSKVVANNKKARHDYFVDEVYECGLALTGTEIKSVRAGKVSITEGYAKVERGEVILYGVNIGPGNSCCTKKKSANSSAKPPRRGTPWCR